MLAFGRLQNCRAAVGTVTASVVLHLQYPPKKSVVNSEETEASKDQLSSICSSLASLALSEDFLLAKWHLCGVRVRAAGLLPQSWVAVSRRLLLVAPPVLLAEQLSGFHMGWRWGDLLGSRAPTQLRLWAGVAEEEQWCHYGSGGWASLNANWCSRRGRKILGSSKGVRRVWDTNADERSGLQLRQGAELLFESCA